MADHNSFINDKIFKNGATNPRIHGLYVEGSYTLVDHCDIYGNSGLGVSVYNGYAGASANYNVVSNSTVHDNSSASTGSRQGIGLSSGAGNTAFNDILWNNGAGIVVGTNDGTTPATNARVYNNTIYNNNVGGSRYGIYLNSNGSGAVVQNNIAYNNLDGNIVNGGQSGTTMSNNVTVDPLFVNSAGLNFQLLAGSPAIDKGINLSAKGVTDDIAGTPRPQGTAYDIGAYEYTGGTTVTTALAISAVSATGIGTSSATVAWTTNVAADGQVVYGLTSTYGSATTLNAALTTSHSAALSGLTAGTVYHYAVKSHDSAGNLVTSPDATFTTTKTVTTALSISAVSVSGIGTTGATIGWTTNVLADGQVVYGLTSTYGSATTLNATLTTSHSAALSGLTAGTVYHYAVKSHDSAGNLVTSPDATFTTTAAAVTATAGCVASAGTWQNMSQTAQTGSFTAQFDATAGAAAIDGANGLSNGAATAWTSLAAAVRFNNTGNIDARNGGAYAAAAALPYITGMTYHFRLVISIPTHTYSAYVKQGSNAEQLIGSNYAFRTEQASVTSLSNVGVFSDAGTLTTCNASATSLTATVISAVAVSALGQTVATIGWTTNNPADTQVQYGPTSAYGVTTPLNTTPTTTHSVSLGGLTAGTVYHYRVMSRDASGALVTSPDATFTTAAAAVAPPVISGVSATGLSASGATIVWTTDKPADSQVVYGAASTFVTVVSASSIYPSASTLNTALTTSHSVALSGLTASTLYDYAVKSRDSSGNLTTSPNATFTTTAATSGGGGTTAACVTSAGTWQNVAVAAQTGSFTAEFDGTPASLTTDGVSGLSNGPASAFTSLAVAVRFNNTGKIDARNAGGYAAASSIPYKAGTSYHFRLVINIAAHTFSAYVKQGANAEILIGSNFAFRTEQATVTRLNNLGALADAGSVTDCNAVTHL